MEQVMRSRLAGLVLTVGLAGAASAADVPSRSATPPPPPTAASAFDFAFGAKIMTDYISRGITQSNRHPAVTAYGELRYNPVDWLQLYAGGQAWSVKLPTDPALELDGFVGIRPTFGPVAFDFGFIYYGYLNNSRQFFIDGAGVTTLTQVPGSIPTTPKNPGWWEIYGKASYTWNDMVTAGGNLFWSPSWVNTGAHATYVSATLKVALPHGFAISGEFGRQYLGTSNVSLGPTKYVSYNTWNAGVSYTYKVATLDVRYHGTSLNKAQCWLNSSDPAGNPVGVVANGLSKWCGNRIMASLAFDLSWMKDLK
jgi:uncharacterized protein (TIGR02001 family)